MKKSVLSAFLPVLALCLALFAAPALAEPFGTSMGDPMSRFPELSGKSGRTFFVTCVPAPQKDFSKYILTFEEKDGLSAVSGVKEFTESEGGVLPFFSRVCDTLIQEYGPPVKYLDPGWMSWLDAVRPDDKALKAQLHKFSQYGFGAIWLLKDREDGLDMVQVALAAKSETHCTAFVTYFYKNYQDSAAQ